MPWGKRNFLRSCLLPVHHPRKDKTSLPTSRTFPNPPVSKSIQPPQSYQHDPTAHSIDQHIPSRRMPGRDKTLMPFIRCGIKDTKEPEQEKPSKTAGFPRPQPMIPSDPYPHRQHPVFHDMPGLPRHKLSPVQHLRADVGKEPAKQRNEDPRSMFRRQKIPRADVNQNGPDQGRNPPEYRKEKATGCDTMPLPLRRFPIGWFGLPDLLFHSPPNQKRIFLSHRIPSTSL